VDCLYKVRDCVAAWQAEARPTFHSEAGGRRNGLIATRFRPPVISSQTGTEEFERLVAAHTQKSSALFVWHIPARRPSGVDPEGWYREAFTTAGSPATTVMRRFVATNSVFMA
jgi:hypothetical protein